MGLLDESIGVNRVFLSMWTGLLVQKLLNILEQKLFLAA